MNNPRPDPSSSSSRTINIDRVISHSYIEPSLNSNAEPEIHSESYSESYSDPDSRYSSMVRWHDPDTPLRPSIRKKKQSSNPNNNINDDVDEDNNNINADTNGQFKNKNCKPLIYTNHILQEIQECLFHEKKEEYIPKLFFILTKFSYDMKDEKYNIYDYKKNIWVLKDKKEIYNSIITVINDFINDYINLLRNYKETLDGKWRDSELHTTPLFYFIPNGDEMRRWQLWDEALQWEYECRENLTFNLEVINDPYVYRDHYLPVQDEEYNQLMQTYLRENKPLAERYNAYYLYLFGQRTSVSNNIDSKLANKIKNQIEWQIYKLQKLSSRLNYNSARINHNIITSVLKKGQKDETEPAVNWLIAFADDSILNIKELTLERRTPYHYTTAFCCQKCPDLNFPNRDQFDMNIMNAFNIDVDTHSHLMAILALATSSLVKNTYLFIISGSNKNKRLLQVLLSETFGSLHDEMDAEILTKNKFDVGTVKDKRIVSFNDVKFLSDTVLGIYLHRSGRWESGGKKYRFSTNFILFVNDFPIMNSRYHQSVYYLNIGGDEKQFIPNNDLIQDFLSSCIYYANCYCNYEGEIELPPLPSVKKRTKNDVNLNVNVNVDTNVSISDLTIDKKKLRKSTEQTSLEKELFNEFIEKRVVINIHNVNIYQSAEEFRQNFRKFLLDKKEENQDIFISNGREKFPEMFSDVSIGKYIGGYMKKRGVTYDNYPKRDGSKTPRIYDGLKSYPHDI